MDLVDKEHITFFEIRQDRGEVAGLLDNRTRRRFQRRAHFIRDNIREGSLTDSGRPGEKYVIESFPPTECGRHEDPEIVLNFFLADVLAERGRTQSKFEARLL